MNSRVIANPTSFPTPPDGDGGRPDELVALVALVRSHVFPADELSAAVDYYGSAAAVLDQVLQGSLPAASGQHALIGTDDALIQRVAGEVAGWRREGLDVRTVLDDTYPPNLLSIHNRPPWLFFQGAWDSVRDSRAVAVVGTRQATDEGIRRAHRLSRELVEAGFSVFSGMARGIDTAAHIAALQAGGRTVAVMGTGIHVRYPRENARLADSIVAAGSSLVSQFLPAQPPTKWTFPARNVVMSGLALATAVVEAGETSGAKMQAEAALLHGRSVFLPSSLVAAHGWARRLVETGIRDSRAVEVGSTDDIVKRLTLDESLAPPLAV